MVTSEQSDALGPPRFEEEEEGEGLEGVVPAVDEVPHEYVVGVRDVPARLQQLEEVVELSVDVAADGHRRAHRLHVALLHQQLLDVAAERLQLGLLQRLALLDLRERDASEATRARSADGIDGGKGEGLSLIHI